MKTFKFILIFMLAFVLQSNQANACGCSSSITINGPTSLCGAATVTHPVVISCSSFTTVTCTGGFILATTAVPAGSSIDATGTILTIPSVFAGTVTLTVAWNASGTRTLVGAANSAFGNSSDTHTVSGPYISYLNGPEGLICRSTTSVSYSASSSGGTSRLWTATSSGSPITLTSPTSSWTTINGLTPNNMYSVNYSVFCGSTSVATSSTYVVTGTPLPCSPPTTAPGEGNDGNSTEGIAVSEGDLNTVEYLENENGIIKVNAREDLQLAEQKLTEIRVYPNPVGKNASVTVDLPETKGSYLIELIDMQGKVVYSMETSDTNFGLSTSQWPTGIYNVRIQSEEISANRKLIIN